MDSELATLVLMGDRWILCTRGVLGRRLALGRPGVGGCWVYGLNAGGRPGVGGWEVNEAAIVDGVLVGNVVGI